MNYYYLKIPVYITDELGSYGSLLMVLLGVLIIFLAILMGKSNNSFVSAFGEELIFKIGIGVLLTGIIALLISLF